MRSRSRSLPLPPIALLVLHLVIGGAARAQALEPGDLVVADRDGMGPARLVQVERATGRTRTLYASWDGVLTAPRDVEIDAARRIVASQSATPLRPASESIVRFDPAAGALHVVSSGGLLADVDGIGLAPDGAIYAADHGTAAGEPPSIVRIDAETGAQQRVSRGGLLVRPVDVAVEPSGALLVLDGGTGSGAKLVRVAPGDGSQTALVAPGPLGPAAGGVAIDADGSIVVLAALGALYRVEPATGAVTPAAAGSVVSTDLALEPDGDVLVLKGGDADRLDRVDRATGTVMPIAAGFTSPMGVAVARATAAFCDVEIAKARHRDGDVVSVSTLRLANPLAAPLATEFVLRLAIPVLAAPIEMLRIPMLLPARRDAELAPFSLAAVHAGLPRGAYQLGCAFEHPETRATQAADAASFVLE